MNGGLSDSHALVDFRQYRAPVADFVSIAQTQVGIPLNRERQGNASGHGSDARFTFRSHEFEFDVPSSYSGGICACIRLIGIPRRNWTQRDIQ